MVDCVLRAQVVVETNKSRDKRAHNYFYVATSRPLHELFVKRDASYILRQKL